MKINLKEISKFLSGAFFVTAGASWYFAAVHLSVPFFNTSMSPEFLGIRGFFHFGMCVLTFWYGFLKK
jgi:hypothetical protein